MTTTFHRRTRKERFGEILRREGLITQEQLVSALEVQRRSGGFLGEILVELGAIAETDIVKTISVQLQVPVIRPAQYEVDRELLKRFTPEFIYTYRVLPFDRVHDLILVATPDVPSEETLAALRQACGTNVAIFVSSVTDIECALNQLMPVTEDQRERFNQIRRRRTCAAPPTEEGTDETLLAPAAAEESPAEIDILPAAPRGGSGESDTSWEAIFDEAEHNLKQDS